MTGPASETARKEPEWVLITKEGAGIFCERCLGSHEFKLPMRVKDYTKAAAGFVTLHSFCEGKHDHQPER